MRPWTGLHQDILNLLFLFQESWHHHHGFILTVGLLSYKIYISGILRPLLLEANIRDIIDLFHGFLLHRLVFEHQLIPWV